MVRGSQGTGVYSTRPLGQTGSFAPIWWAGIALAIFAAAIHWPIVESRAPRFATLQPEA